MFFCVSLLTRIAWERFTPRLCQHVIASHYQTILHYVLEHYAKANTDSQKDMLSVSLDSVLLFQHTDHIRYQPSFILLSVFSGLSFSSLHCCMIKLFLCDCSYNTNTSLHDVHTYLMSGALHQNSSCLHCYHLLCNYAVYLIVFPVIIAAGL